MRQLLKCLLAGGVLAVAATPARAQTPQVVLSADCKAAIRQITQQGITTVESAILFVLPQCGKAGATATVASIAITRRSSDTLLLARVYDVVDAWRDAAVMKAAIGVTRDATASVPARVFALRHLLQLISPAQQFTYGNLVVGDVRGQGANASTTKRGCRRMLASENPTSSATPLASDYAQQIRAVIEPLVSGSAPLPLRNAAACLDL